MVFVCQKVTPHPNFVSNTIRKPHEAEVTDLLCFCHFPQVLEFLLENALELFLFSISENFPICCNLSRLLRGLVLYSTFIEISGVNTCVLYKQAYQCL